MIRIQDLGPTKGARKHKKIVGRGMGSGRGKTCGRGNKGQMSRTGSPKQSVGSEGGQMPLIRRMPKRGFPPRDKAEYSIVNLERLNIFKDETNVTPSLLIEKGLIKTKRQLVKILGKGELKRKLVVAAHAFSGSAKAAIEKLGGKAEIIGDGSHPSVRNVPKREPSP